MDGNRAGAPVQKPPVIIVAGPTASGKSGLALALAEAFRGTIVNADSLQCYRDLDILTARPDAAAQALVPHRLYGWLDAAQRGSAALWRARAAAEIEGALGAGRLPLLVGGTGLYLRALQQGLAPIPDIPQAVRLEASKLHQALGGAGFRDALMKLDPQAANRLPPGDTTRLRRAWEVVQATGIPIAEWQRRAHDAALWRFFTVLLLPAREHLYAACDARFAAMVEAGGLEEAARLAARGLDPGLPAMKAVGVPELLRHLRGEITREAAIAEGQRATRRYAKRQLTWFHHQLAADVTIVEPQGAAAALHEEIRQFLFDRRGAAD
jgi:tRNA dimethylallyltransferase